MDLHADIFELRAFKSETADRFGQLQIALNKTGESTNDPRLRLDIVKERDDCLQEIRNIPASRGFLRAPSI